MSPKTLYDKIWDAHVAHEAEDGTCLLYIDRHLVHEVTSPQAFEGLRLAGRKVHAPDKTIAVPDHNVPTTAGREDPAQMTEESRIQVEALDKNAREFGVHYYPVSDVRQGIVHIVGPEQGWTLPGMTVVKCGNGTRIIDTLCLICGRTERGNTSYLQGFKGKFARIAAFSASQPLIACPPPCI